MYENIPDCIRNENKWVCARSNRKMPLRADMLLTAYSAPFGYINYEDVCASVSNPETWGTFEDALRNVNHKICSHIGYVFDGNGIIGIDLDHCFEEGILKPEAAAIINKIGSYTEISKSGEGIHILVRARIPFTGSNNRKGIEIYSTNRFFILTGNNVLYNDIIENQEGVDWLLAEYFQKESVTKNPNVKPHKPTLYKRDIRLVDSKLRINYPKIEQGSRNCTLLSYGGILLSKGLPIIKIREKMLVLNSKCCQPPLSVDEVDTIMRSVVKYDTNREVM